MKNPSSYLIIIIVTVLALFSCKQDEVPAFAPVPEPSLYTVTLQAGTEDTAKSAVANDGSFTWQSGDALAVYTTLPGFNDSFTTGDSGAASANFNGSIPVGTSVSTVAVFPSRLAPSLDGSNLTVNLPATLTEEQWRDQANNPMVAKIASPGETSLSFKNICGMFRFTLANIPVGTQSVRLTAASGNLAGAFTADLSQELPVINNGGGNSPSVTFEFDAPLASVQTHTFYLPAPVGTYSGFEVVALDASDAKLGAFTTNAANTIARKSFKRMPIIPFESIGAGISAYSIPATTGVVSLCFNAGDSGQEVTLSYASETLRPTKVSIYARNLGSLAFSLPASTVTIEGGSTIGTVSGETAPSTLYVQEGVSLESLTVTGGSSDIAGSVDNLTLDYSEEAIAAAQEAGVALTSTIESTASVGAVTVNSGDLVVESSVGSVTANGDATVTTSGSGSITTTGGSAPFASNTNDLPEDSGWQTKPFYHRSLSLMYTGTHCGQSPAMHTAMEKAGKQFPGKLVQASFYDAGSTLSFDRIRDYFTKFSVYTLPVCVVDYRNKLKVSETIDFDEEVYETVTGTEYNYGTATGMHVKSSVAGSTLTVEVNVYAKKADTYWLNLLLVEDGVMAMQADYEQGRHMAVHDNVVRKALTSTLGQKFVTDSDNQCRKFSFTVDLPQSYKLENLRLVAYTLRSFHGSAIEGIDYWRVPGVSAYVDNAVSAKVGSDVPLDTTGEVSNDGAGNEDISNGGSILL